VHLTDAVGLQQFAEFPHHAMRRKIDSRSSDDRVPAKIAVARGGRSARDEQGQGKSVARCVRLTAHQQRIRNGCHRPPQRVQDFRVRIGGIIRHLRERPDEPRLRGWERRFIALCQKATSSQAAPSSGENAPCSRAGRQ